MEDRNSSHLTSVWVCGITQSITTCCYTHPTLWSSIVVQASLAFSYDEYSEGLAAMWSSVQSLYMLHYLQHEVANV